MDIFPSGGSLIDYSGVARKEHTSQTRPPSRGPHFLLSGQRRKNAAKKSRSLPTQLRRRWVTSVLGGLPMSVDKADTRLPAAVIENEARADGAALAMMRECLIDALAVEEHR
jgi:hypothetical protein